MKRLFLAGALSVVMTLNLRAAEGPDATMLEHARKVLAGVPIIDGHNDLPWELRQQTMFENSKVDLRTDTSKLAAPLMTDIPRLRKGGVGAQFWSVYVSADFPGPIALRTVTEQIDIVDRMVARYPETFELARSADDILRIEKKGRIASLIGIEGGHSIDNSLPVLRQLYNLGARYMTLTHSKNNDWADSATDAPKHNGLTTFGKEVVREMNRLGMLVDLSHVSPKTMNDVLDVVEAPVIFSHSSARGIVNHPRDVPDQILRRLASKDGVVMITFVPSFISEKVRAWSAAKDGFEASLKTLNPEDPQKVNDELDRWTVTNPMPPVSVADVADHIDHVRKVAGIDHIGMGGDFDGIKFTIPGLDSVDDYPALFAELIRRGYSDADLEKIAGRNLLRVFRQVEAVARRIQTLRGASEMAFETGKP